MIISEKYHFVFIHIPKCAGSTIRNRLKFIDSTASFYGALQEHSGFGKIDYGHIPLSVLEKHFPESYKKLQDYFSFCIIRDPHERFPSSLAQHLRMYKNLKLADLSKSQFKVETEKMIGLLEKHRNIACLPYDLIHFQKQVSYVFNGENKIIKNVYTIENVNSVFIDLSIKTGLEISTNDISTGKKVNRSLVFRNHTLGYVFDLIKPFTAKVLKHSPWNFKGKVSQYVYMKPKEKFNDILSSNYVKAFINDYYRDDIMFYQSLTKEVK
jgi:hypothetical protein